MSELEKFLDFLESHKTVERKDELIKQAELQFRLTKDGNIYRTETFAARFCYSKNGKFGNTILSLSRLEKYDKIPFLVILVILKQDNKVFLANSTLIKKISHSSKHLSLNNIRGSFNGSDILKNVNGLENCPKNIPDLFATHIGLSWQDNLERLVEATKDIQSKTHKTELTTTEYSILFQSPTRALSFINSPDYSLLKKDLNTRCEEARDAIFIAKNISNINLRGRLIESLITAPPETRIQLCSSLQAGATLPEITTSDDIGDYVLPFSTSTSYTDIKTKILYLNSNPKAYNIDKFLRLMGTDKTVFLFFFIGLDKEGIITQLCSVFHEELLRTSLFQTHWAGRSTRGVVQFSGNAINKLLKRADFRNEINVEEARRYLQTLLER